jgi:hypothetical protein
LVCVRHPDFGNGFYFYLEVVEIGTLHLKKHLLGAVEVKIDISSVGGNK